ncbi:MAG: hypothetical protein ACRYFU_00715 [Janthinobacterium lividum]
MRAIKQFHTDGSSYRDLGNTNAAKCTPMRGKSTLTEDVAVEVPGVVYCLYRIGIPVSARAFAEPKAG